MKLTHAFKVCFLLGAVAMLSLLFLENYSQTITFESSESKNVNEVPVINTVGYKRENGVSTWSMQQNHHDGKDVDDLKIIVQSKGAHKEASFYQFKDNMNSEYRVSCFTCHANGPRAIRYNANSKVAKVNVLEEVVIAYWNLKIKHQGTVNTKQNTQIEQRARVVPLKFEGRLDTKAFKLESCSLCHGAGSIMGRAELQYQQLGTIKHLVETEQMPPLFFTVSKEDRDYLWKKFKIKVAKR